MGPRLYRVIQPVTDIALAARFYAAVMEEPGRRVSPGRHYFGGEGGGAILACYDPTSDGDGVGEGWRHHPSQYLYFSVDDLEGARRRCEAAGATQITEIADMLAVLVAERVLAHVAGNGVELLRVLVEAEKLTGYRPERISWIGVVLARHQ